ncbi:hypothetical protein [Roseomonas sp. BN140053]|uniref:hypothetical protein n=1 Tax=Roseomonas sp. BN140053 TaxID=3391898 RepID=UPI0039ED48F5
MRRLLIPALLASPLAALAQDRPLLEPQRDVAVTYRLLGEGAPSQQIGWSWLAAERILRSDMPDGSGYALNDRNTGSLRVVMEARRTVVTMPRNALPTPGMQASPTARFTQAGTATVAGQPCTNWRIQDQGTAVVSCFTADGVLLRTEGANNGRTAGLEAVSVSYAAQDAARFHAPAGYRAVSLPEGARPGGPGPGGTAPDSAAPGGTAGTAPRR